MVDNITFDAVVYKVQTTVDGAIRLTFDLPESAIDAAAWLMECKRTASSLHVACVMNMSDDMQSITRLLTGESHAT